MAHRRSTSRKPRAFRKPRPIVDEVAGVTSWGVVLDRCLELPTGEVWDDEEAVFAVPRAARISKRLVLEALNGISVTDVIARVPFDTRDRLAADVVETALREQLGDPTRLPRLGLAVASLKGLSDLEIQMSRLYVPPELRAGNYDERMDQDSWGFAGEVRDALHSRRLLPSLRLLLDELLAGVLLENPANSYRVSRIESRFLRRLLRLEYDLSSRKASHPAVRLDVGLDDDGRLFLNGAHALTVKRSREEVDALRAFALVGYANLTPSTQKRVSTLVAKHTENQLLVRSEGKRQNEDSAVVCTVQDRVTYRRAKVVWLGANLSES
jgi:hypothetical protein